MAANLHTRSVPKEPLVKPPAESIVEHERVLAVEDQLRITLAPRSKVEIHVEFVEETSPHQQSHSALPDDTVDFWGTRDVLALGVLTSFVWHSGGVTLTELIKRSPGVDKIALTRAYTRLFTERFLIKVNLTCPSEIYCHLGADQVTPEAQFVPLAHSAGDAR
jgi:hypothetical protein